MHQITREFLHSFLKTYILPSFTCIIINIIVSPHKALYPYISLYIKRSYLGGGTAVCVGSLSSVKQLRTERTEETEETLPADGGLYLVSELTVGVGASIKTQGI